MGDPLRLMFGGSEDGSLTIVDLFSLTIVDLLYFLTSSIDVRFRFWGLVFWFWIQNPTSNKNMRAKNQNPKSQLQDHQEPKSKLKNPDSKIKTLKSKRTIQSQKIETPNSRLQKCWVCGTRTVVNCSLFWLEMSAMTPDRPDDSPSCESWRPLQ